MPDDSSTPGLPAPSSSTAKPPQGSMSELRAEATKSESRMAFGVAIITAGAGAVLDAIVSALTTLWFEGPAQAVRACIGLVLGLVLICIGWCVFRSGSAKRRSAEAEITARGTLYYVRLLEPGMRDRHLEQLDSAGDQHEERRAVTRWISSGIREVGGLRAIDAATDVHEFSRDLQLTMNDDTNSTAFTLAPNLLWPMAVGLGYSSYLFTVNTQLGEVPDRGTDFPRHPVNLDPWDGSEADIVADQRLVLVKLALLGPISTPAEWQSVPTVNVCLPDNEVLTLSKEHDGTPAPHGNLIRRYHDPNRIASLCARSIFTAMKRNPGADVALVARLPKTVAFLLGWRLGQKLECDRPERGRVPEETDYWYQNLNPWERLLTVQLQPPSFTPVVTRVHPSQRPLEEMIAVTQRLYDPA